MKNKKGWIKILEAVIAILLITSVVLVVINRGYIERRDISSKVYAAELSILREIQLDDNLRNDILEVIPPSEWDDESFPLSVKNKIVSRTPNYLYCEAKICEMYGICGLEKYPEKDVYAQSVTITTTLETPPEEQLKQLKLFCWTM